MKKLLLNWLLFWVGLIFSLSTTIFIVNAVSNSDNGLYKNQNESMTANDRNSLVAEVNYTNEFYLGVLETISNQLLRMNELTIEEVKTNHYCRWDFPKFATMCNNTESNVGNDTHKTWHGVQECNSTKKCEYVLNQCSDLTYNYLKWCPDATIDISMQFKDTKRRVSEKKNCSGNKCEYYWQ